MKKQIFITNGMARCGKDTFAILLNEFISVRKISSITCVKQVAAFCGWCGEKTERDRKLLSDLKKVTTEYNDLSFRYIKSMVIKFLNDSDCSVLLIDIREPEEIERAKKEFGAKTILIVNDNVEHITSNSSDAGVYDYGYDYIIENNCNLYDFRESVKTFVKSIGMEV